MAKIKSLSFSNWVVGGASSSSWGKSVVFRIYIGVQTVQERRKEEMEVYAEVDANDLEEISNAAGIYIVREDLKVHKQTRSTTHNFYTYPLLSLYLLMVCALQGR